MAIAAVLATATPETSSVFAQSNETSQYGGDGVFGASGNTTFAAVQEDALMELRQQEGNTGKEQHNKKDKKNIRSNHNRQPNNKPSKRTENNSNNNKNKPNHRQQGNNNNSSSRSSCFSINTYKSLDNDIASIANGINDDKRRSHFLGGIVRLAAHDFMDYNLHASNKNRMGSDGCYDKDHPSNAGLDTIWCSNCPLKRLYAKKYSHLSRADFWIASANAVIRQTSIDNALDMKDTFRWGRKDTDACDGSGNRLPEASGCDEVEGVFLKRMGLRWSDAVALLGAHTLGRAKNEVRSTYTRTPTIYRRILNDGNYVPIKLTIFAHLF